MTTTDWSKMHGELLLGLDQRAGRRSGLESALRQAIRSGALAAGTRLPATRELAGELGWARGTVVEAYEQLAAEGWLHTRGSGGTLVAAAAARSIPARAERPPAAAPRYDLRAGSPDVAAFPRRDWGAALRRVLRDAPDDVLRLGDPRGRPELRAALAAQLGRVRGVVADPAQIVICAGFTQALALLAAVLRERGARALALEDPCLDSGREIVRAAGLGVLPIAVDAQGARPSTIPAGAAAAFVTPSHQHPLGATLAPQRRAQLIAWARGADAYVVEDDYDGEFRYDRQAVGALHGLAPDRVIYAGTTSKTLAPALRLAWVVVPHALLEAFVEHKRLADKGAPALEQLALAELFACGAYDRHLRRMRPRYHRRRDALLAALPAGVRALGIAAGLHVVLELAAGGPSEDELLARAHERSLGVYGLARFWHAPRADRPPALLVGYATPPEHAFAGALAALADVLRPASPAPRPRAAPAG